MDERRNYYRILGVQPDASRAVIRSAYRTLLQKLQMHPDLGGDDRTAAMINAAWHTLGNTVRRGAYDRALLAEYDIRMIAAAGEPVTRTPAANDRRNYYRILGVQPDAPAPLIDSAYRVMAGVRGNDVSVEEAYRVLGDEQRRRAYDAAEAGSEVEAEAESEVEVEAEAEAEAEADEAKEQPQDSAGYKPVIGTYCFFCKTPHDSYPGAEDRRRCAECASPLRRAMPDSASSQRELARADVDCAVMLFDYWPGAGWAAMLEDLTPQGMRVNSER
ncbi:MAG: J domain-containing protein, partial [Gammaproteobacteria bacterium]|nr:J domain-containing protein [Gammaproteobacteria bacterium]